MRVNSSRRTLNSFSFTSHSVAVAKFNEEESETVICGFCFQLALPMYLFYTNFRKCHIFFEY